MLHDNSPGFYHILRPVKGRDLIWSVTFTHTHLLFVQQLNVTFKPRSKMILSIFSRGFWYSFRYCLVDEVIAVFPQGLGFRFCNVSRIDAVHSKTHKPLAVSRLHSSSDGNKTANVLVGKTFPTNILDRSRSLVFTIYLTETLVSPPDTFVTGASPFQQC